MISVESHHFETKGRERRRIIYFIAKKGRGGREGGREGGERGEERKGREAGRGERRGRKEGRSVK